MKTICLLIFLNSMLLHSIFGQTDTVINEIKYNYVSRYNNGQIFELGNYLNKNQKKIKQGTWIIFNENGEQIEKGAFLRNKKVGKWIELGPDKLCCYTGNYKNGKKDGYWTNGVNKQIHYKRGKILGISSFDFIR